ncbi:MULTISPECIES: LuxR C-terminal-related transcriptional regulator [Streptomyces]|uniref:LuxR C-terminal-related transcriptional regulator n=1 Tax=Streptomyces celluloflavus TaxID=58344 RepID=A0ABW7RJ13_9ACTN|nr:DNA-binding response regulator [Streptomyces sp. SID7805]WSK13820.1 response regulator transcription factor [Streptomyces celluloflavus]
MLEERVTVTVHASDPLSRAGVISHLQHQPSLELLQGQVTTGHGTGTGPGKDRGGAVDPHPDGTAATPATPGIVAVMIVDRLDDVATAELRRLVRGGEQRVVLVARELREPELMTVVECGIRAILWRHQATPQRLLRAVRSAARDEGELPPDLIGRLLTQVGRLRRSVVETTAGAAVPTLGMAPREVDVLRLVAEGMDTRQISEKLSYSERTVKNVLHALMTRLQLNNRAHAVAYALREGYI